MFTNLIPRMRSVRALWRGARCALAAGALVPAIGAARETIPLDAGWRFFRGDVPMAQSPSSDVSSWQTVELPHDWSIDLPVDIHEPSGGAGGFFTMGIGWYRRTFNAPASWKGQRVVIEFDGVYENAEVWLNGSRLGEHPYGFTPFSYDVTRSLRSGENVLAVRVDNSPQPNCRWYSGSGIYRHVRLLVTAPLHVADGGLFVRTAALSDERADVVATVTVERTPASDAASATDSAVELRLTLFDPAGHEVASKVTPITLPTEGRADASVTFTLPHPRLWSPVTPVLYRATAEIRSGGERVDAASADFGVRTVAVSAEHGFQLNGRTIKLVGADVHADNGPLGTAAFDRAEERRVQLLKEAGFNAIRTAHNPPSTAFLDACDRAGMLVLDEAFDGWEKSKTPHDYGNEFRDWWRRDLDAMVLRDRDHPSVVLWSIGNEMYERGNASGLRIARELTGRIRELDPSRPITAGVNGPGKGGDWTKMDPLFATLDVAGYNYELSRHVADHERVPQRVIVVTESYQSETFANWAVAHDTPYVIGDFVWSGMDYLGEAGIGRVFPPGQPVVKHWEGDQYPWHGAACGDIDITGWRKPISHYRNIVWNRGERLYATVLTPTPAAADAAPITASATDGGWGVSPWAMPPSVPSWTWPGQDSKPLTVEVYSRYDHVRLYLNGHLLAEKPTDRTTQFIARFVVPYVPGTLKAVGVEHGCDAETFALETADAPTEVRLEPDRTVLQADGSDLSFVSVELTDGRGRWNSAEDRPVSFVVAGPATIAAVANGDLTSPETYGANPHPTYQGRALVILRSTHLPGIVTLTASAGGMHAARIELQTVEPKTFKP
ncbi:MAG TPA: glycoside hydrolase family 2 TIM barrel-domain containing protein [Opitutaceae bacterium]|nr:glycoside hydrolase family 2 TIM barrel-domain containing protein [Opitutaceae bacterium]